MTISHARAAILSIGDEIVLGQTLDTNSRWLSRRLMDAGVSPGEHATVPDDLPAIAGAITRLASTHPLVVVTGGLGPTLDDLTREALARVSGEALIEDPISLEQVRAWFVSRGRAMPPINALQAMRPPSAVALPNLRGTAPGLFMRLTHEGGESDVACLPGPPGEMMPMFESHILPRLRPPAGRVIRSRVLHCFGIGESDLATRLGELMDRGRVPLVGTTASGGVVSCRLRYEGAATTQEADGRLDQTARDVRRRAGGYVFGEGDDSLPGVVVRRLRGAGRTLGTVESCTGGLLSQLVTGVPGASDVFRGGVVTYANTLKEQLVGVDASLLAPTGPGAVSAEVARAMAVGGLSALGVSDCLAITGIAGPGGAVAGKPVGTVFIALASEGAASVDVRRFLHAGDREAIRDWSAKCALAMLWQRLVGTSLPLLRELPAG